jgi:hypothetical protein
LEQIEQRTYEFGVPFFHNVKASKAPFKLTVPTPRLNIVRERREGTVYRDGDPTIHLKGKWSPFERSAPRGLTRISTRALTCSDAENVMNNWLFSQKLRLTDCASQIHTKAVST